MFLQKLNEVIASKKSFISDKLNSVSMGLALLINIIHWGLLIIKIKPGNTNILLHYNVVYGSDLVEKASYVYIIPGIALFFFVLNLLFLIWFYEKEKVLSYFLSFSSIAVQAVFFVASIVLIIANA